VRFRPKFSQEVWLQIVSLSGWTFILVASVAQRHRLTMMGALAIVWAVMLVAQLSVAAFLSWSIGPDGLHRKTLWSSQVIPYTDIVAIRPHTGLLRPSASQIDIVYGQLASALNPRRTTIANLKERAVFLETLRSHAPQTVFEL